MTGKARMYQKMYHVLVYAMEEALCDIAHGNFKELDEILKTALQEAEDIFVLWEESGDKGIEEKKEFLRCLRRVELSTHMTEKESEQIGKKRLTAGVDNP